MSLLDHYRMLYEYEKECNHKMLAMLDSVPDDSRSEPRFQQAVTIAVHLARCRESWLDHMTEGGQPLAARRDGPHELAELRPRFAALEGQWTDYLMHLDEEQWAEDFEFIEEGECFRLPIEVQIVQLMGHAFYHRGQIILLVDQLGGETVDTDYADWWWARQ